MKNIRKITVYFLIGSMILLLCSCNLKQTKSPVTSSDGKTTTVSDTGRKDSSQSTTESETTTATTNVTATTTVTTTEATTLATTTPTRREDGSRIFFRDYELIKTGGTTDKLSDIAKKHTIVCFWRAEYPICLEQISVLEALAAAEPEHVSIVMINTGETKESVEKFALERSSNLSFYLDEDSSIAIDNQVTKLPYLMFLTEDLEVMGAIGSKINQADINVICEKIDEFRANRGE